MAWKDGNMSGFRGKRLRWVESGWNYGKVWRFCDGLKPSASKRAWKFFNMLVYKAIPKPIWTYGVQLWGSASNSNIDILERFQSKALRIVTEAPRYVPNMWYDMTWECSPSDKKRATTLSPTATGLMITPTGWLNLCSKDLPPIVSLSSATLQFRQLDSN